MDEPSDIGTALIARRRALGISQRELGDLIGVKQPQIARWEAAGYRTTSLERIDSVASALNCDLTLETTGGLPLAAEEAAAYAPSPPGSHAEGLNALARLRVDPSVIAAFCRLHGISEFALFGSVLGDGFDPRSDVDVLVAYEPGAEPPDFGTLADLRSELTGIFRRHVDLADRRDVEESENYLRRARILREARAVYVAR